MKIRFIADCFIGIGFLILFLNDIFINKLDYTSFFCLLMTVFYFGCAFVDWDDVSKP